MAVAQPKALFYLTDSPNSVKSFIDHADKIDILVPAWYGVDGNGLMWGGPNPYVLQTAAQHHVPVMPIVATTAQDGTAQAFHDSSGATRPSSVRFSASARKTDTADFKSTSKMCCGPTAICSRSLSPKLRPLCTKKACNLPSPPCPTLPVFPGKAAYSHWLYANWRGAYDLKALAKAADLICLMTYDQNTRWTEPGPGSRLSLDGAADWNTHCRSVPKEKLSLGIPVYGYHWFAGDPGQG